jgi:RND family efflux transporter MFP subunit
MTRNRILLSLLAAALVAAAITALIRHHNAAALEAVHPTRGTAIRAVYATGTVEASVMLPLAPRSGVRLMQLLADEGDKVAKGQRLAQMEDADLQSTIDELKAREARAAADYKRTEALLSSNSISRAQADQARAEYNATRAARARAESEASYLQIIAPDDGTIIRRDGEQGQLIPANQPIFWLTSNAPLRITTEVDEEDVALVQPGQKVLIRADAFGDRSFEGAVQSITPKGDPIARSYRVRISFADAPLQIGMTAETNILVSEHENALLLPTTAIKKDTVWQVENNAATPIKVQTGAHGPEKTEITAGLAEDATVLLNPAATLTPGEAVRIRLIDPTPAP